MDIEIARAADGITPDEAARRTTFVVEHDGRRALVRTAFTSPDIVLVTGTPPSAPVVDAVADEIAWWSPQVREVRWGDEVRRLDAAPLQWVPLNSLTVGQLTVSGPKVEAAAGWVRRSEDVVVSCCTIDDEVMVVDGHSRLVAAHRLGIEEVGITLEEPGPLQHVTRRWCRDAGIVTVADLARHCVDAETHQRMWVDRCQAWLASAADATSPGPSDIAADTAAGA